MDRPNLVFIRYTHTSLVKAIQSVFPNADHGHCTYYIWKNMKAKLKKNDDAKGIMKIFTKLIFQYTLIGLWSS